jgi:hypothetical protein
MTTSGTERGLRLLARDEEDLKVLSAHVQNAVVRMRDIAYLPKAHRFAMVVNRCCWEGAQELDPAQAPRVATGLHFDGVLSAKSIGVDRDDPERVAELLAIRFVPGSGEAGVVELFFLDGGVIRLDVECIEITMRDFPLEDSDLTAGTGTEKKEKF